MEMSEKEATEFFSEFYAGEHHFPDVLKPKGDGWSMKHRGELATYDFNEMTRLVFLAHSKCIRVSVESGGKNRLNITVWKRNCREGRMSERHPTIEDALKTFNSAN